MNKQHLYLVPLLAFYLILIVLMEGPLHGDELRYMGYAENMAQGFYTDSSNPDLSNGPGYPMVLLPFVAMNIDVLLPKLLNGLFVFIAVLFFYKTLCFYTKQRFALLLAIFVGLYPPLLRWMILLYAEAFAFMLISGFVFYFCSLYHEKKGKRKHILLAGLFLGLLVLTKVIFFQVITISALGVLVLYLAKKDRVKLPSALFVLLGALVVAAPFIIYAYSVTGKPFYLGTRGGEILYHRSTPFEEELGNWFSSDNVLGKRTENDATPKTYDDLTKLTENHRDFYLALQPLSNMERDSVFKAKALQNMKEHPLKYLKNSMANISRLLFNYPISYRSQNINALGYIIPNIFIVVLFILVLFPAFISRKKIPFEIGAQLVVALIYGGGMVLLGGKGRYFMVMVPSMVLFIAYVLSNIVKISLNKQESLP